MRDHGYNTIKAESQRIMQWRKTDILIGFLGILAIPWSIAHMGMGSVQIY